VNLEEEEERRKRKKQERNCPKKFVTGLKRKEGSPENTVFNWNHELLYAEYSTTFEGNYR
jgi:hypothetical protein